MIIVDDLLLKPFVSILDAIHTLALSELYNIEEIENELKENQLLYEVGERSEEEYERRKLELEEELELAETVHEELRNKQIRIQG